MPSRIGDLKLEISEGECGLWLGVVGESGFGG